MLTRQVACLSLGEFVKNLTMLCKLKTVRFCLLLGVEQSNERTNKQMNKQTNKQTNKQMNNNTITTMNTLQYNTTITMIIIQYSTQHNVVL